MDDLMGFAAKAAGAKWTDYSDKTPNHWEIQHADKVWRRWRPLEDDGDALRLAAKLCIDIEWQNVGVFPEPCVEAYRREGDHGYFCASEHEKDYRRAIVRAAAAIGQAMERGRE